LYYHKVGTFESENYNMRCRIHFYLLNAHFSMEHAETHHDGEESEFNQMFEWEDELAITSEVEGIESNRYTTYPLQGVLPDGTQFSHEVSEMRLFEIKTVDQPITYVGCSESILDSYEIKEDNEQITLRVYIKDYEPMSNPVPGIYIAAQEFPKELIM
jgi:hypothetical protein